MSIARDWIDTGTRHTYPCDVCQAPATFATMQAPDCVTTAHAGCNGARSDVYGIYCAVHS